MNFGALYSLVCGTLGPLIDHGRLEADIAGRAAYADLFDPSPLLTACEVWPAGTARNLRPRGPSTCRRS